MFDLSLLESIILDDKVDLSGLESIIPEYRKVLRNKKYSHVILKGGRGSGKTISIAKFLLLKSFSSIFSGTNFLCLRQFQNSIQDSVKNELENLITKNNLSQYFSITKLNIVNNKNNISFLFKGADDFVGSSMRQKALNRDKIKGYTNVSFVWIEEAQSVSEGVLDVLIPTPRIPQIKCRFFYTMNPTLSCDPVIKKIGIRNDAIVLHRNIFDLPKKYQNKNLLEEANIASDYPNYNHIWLGEALSEIQGQPFLHILESDILEKVNNRVKKFLFIDPSFKGIDYTAIAVVYKGVNFLNIQGFCFAKAWNNCIDDVKSIIVQERVDYCYYEDNCLGNIVSDVFILEGIKISPVTNTKNKISRIYSMAHLNSSMLFKSGKEHKIFNDQVRYYESEVSKNNSLFNDDAPDSLASCLVQMGY